MVSMEEIVVKTDQHKDVHQCVPGQRHSANIAQQSEPTPHDRASRSFSTLVTPRSLIASRAATVFSKFATALQVYWLPGQRNSDRLMRECIRKSQLDEEGDDVQK